MQPYTPMPPGTFLKNNRYRIQRFLTAGGFGAVYIAEDTLLTNRLCVLKESFDQTPDGRAQFEIEAATLSTLNHPHLVRVTDNFIEPNQKLYLAMEYIEGEDLEEMLKRAPAGLPEQQVLAWLDQVLDAVAYCHTFDPKVIHRDIKPPNIRVRKADDKAVLVDFGIAKIGGSTAPTRQAARAISDGYSPPEQYAGHTDTYSDVYALGATFYHLLTGHTPPVSTDIQYVGAVLTPPRTWRPAISPATEQIILNALQLKIQDRYQTAADMRLVLHGQSQTVKIGGACPYCGAPLRGAARFCRNCGRSIAPITPLVFPKAGHQAQTVAELVHGCDSYWSEACELFRQGLFEPWLASLNETSLAQHAQATRARYADPAAALEEFLETAAPTRSKPILTARPPLLDFGKVTKGDSKVLTLTVANTGRGYLHGKASVDPSAWLTVHPDEFSCLAGAQPVLQVEVKTANLSGDELGAPYTGRIIVQSNRGAQTIDVQLTVLDPPQVQVTPQQIDVGVLAFGARTAQTVQVGNQGGGALLVTVRTLDDWIVLLDATGQHLGQTTTNLPALRRGHHTTLQLAVDSQRLPTRGRHEGCLRIEAANARNPAVLVPVSVTVDLPYRLEATDPASAIAGKEPLWRWCDAHWTAALAYLANGRLAVCLQFMGEARLAQTARQVQTIADANRGLEILLRACGAPAPVQWESNVLDVEGDLGFGLLPKLFKRPDVVRFRILNKNTRGYLHGHLEPTATWLSIPRPHFGCLPGQIAEVEIHANYKAQRGRFLAMGEPLFDIVTE